MALAGIGMDADPGPAVRGRTWQRPPGMQLIRLLPEADILTDPHRSDPVPRVPAEPAYVTETGRHAAGPAIPNHVPARTGLHCSGALPVPVRRRWHYRG